MAMKEFEKYWLSLQDIVEHNSPEMFDTLVCDMTDDARLVAFYATNEFAVIYRKVPRLGSFIEFADVLYLTD